MIGPHHEERRGDRGRHVRHRHEPERAPRHHSLPLTADGVPAAIPDAPRPSPVVLVSAASRAEHPWLPARVIAGSVWRGPGDLRVRVDGNGDARPWRSRYGVRR